MTLSMPLRLIPLGALLFPAVPAPAQSDPGYVERAAELGLEHRVLSGWDDFGSGTILVRDWAQTGLALGDVDGDARLDVVAVGGPLPNRVLLQDATGRFAELAEAGIRSGELDRIPALGDYDRDGDLDLFVGVHQGVGTGPIPGRGRLYRNDGTGRFTDVTAASGTVGNGRTLHALWYDLDLDGRLDLYTSEFHLTPNLYYRNNGDGTFVELGQSVGIADGGSAHASSAIDADGDGWPDVLVGNDHLVAKIVSVPAEENEGDAHLASLGDGLFTDVTVGSGFGQERGIMGLAFGDVDHDGRLDCYKTDIGSNWMLVNRGWPGSGQPWQDRTGQLGVADTVVPFHEQPGKFGPTSGWATMFLDVDLDSWVDLFVVNGHVAGVNPNVSALPRRQPNTLYRGLGPGANFRFQAATGAVGLYDEYDDRAGAMGDVDRDGDVDLFVVETAGRLRYFENRVDRQGRGALSVRVQSGTSAPHGIGAVVRYDGDDGWPRLRGLGADAPTAGQNEVWAHFGLGDQPSVDLVVELPSGITLTQPGVPRDADLTLVEPTLFELSSPVLRATGGGPDTLPDELVVRVFPHDAQGQPLPPGAAVTLEVPGLVALGDALIVGEALERRFAAPELAGEYRLEVTFDGWTPRVRPRIHAVGPVDPVRSGLTTDTLGVRAGSDDGFRVEVAPKDAHGVGLGLGRAVSIEVPGALPQGPVADLGDGRYARSFAAPGEPTVLTVLATVDGVPLAPQPTVDVAGPADPSRTEVVVAPPRAPQAASPLQAKLTVLARDAQGRRLGGRAEVELRVRFEGDPAAPSTPRNGGAPGFAPPQVGSGTLVPAPGVPPAPGPRVFAVAGFETLPRFDGTRLFAVERAESIGEEAVAEVDIRVDGVLVRQALPVPFEF